MLSCSLSAPLNLWMEIEREREIELLTVGCSPLWFTIISKRFRAIAMPWTAGIWGESEDGTLSRLRSRNWWSCSGGLVHCQSGWGLGSAPMGRKRSKDNIYIQGQKTGYLSYKSADHVNPYFSTYMQMVNNFELYSLSVDSADWLNWLNVAERIMWYLISIRCIRITEFWLWLHVRIISVISMVEDHMVDNSGSEIRSDRWARRFSASGKAGGDVPLGSEEYRVGEETFIIFQGPFDTLTTPNTGNYESFIGTDYHVAQA